MNAIKRFENEDGRFYASVVCEPEQSLLMDVWTGELTSQDQVVAVMDYCVGCIQKQGLESWLCDVSQLEGLIEESAKEAANYFKNQLVETSLKKFAFISKKASNTSRTLVSSVLAAQGIEVKTFANNALAMQWLLLPSIDDAVWDEAPVLTF